MSARLRHHALFTEAEYFNEEEFSRVKREFFRGEVFAMAGNSPTHIDVTGNIYASLRAQLKGRPPDVFVSQQRIHVEANSLITYPDVVVVCPPFRFDPTNKITLLDATVIAEVLSNSTRAYDRGEKFELLREMPSLSHYLLVEPDEVRVEHRFRGDDGQWKSEVFAHRDESIELHAIGCRLSVT